MHTTEIMRTQKKSEVSSQRSRCMAGVDVSARKLGEDARFLPVSSNYNWREAEGGRGRLRKDSM